MPVADPPTVWRAVLTKWPLVSAPMAEALTNASRAAVQRTLSWMETNGLIREMTGQGRFRIWCVIKRRYPGETTERSTYYSRRSVAVSTYPFEGYRE